MTNICTCTCFLNDTVGHQVLGDIDGLFSRIPEVETYRLFYGKLLRSRQEWQTPTTLLFVDVSKSSVRYGRPFLTDPIKTGMVAPQWVNWVPFIVGVVNPEQNNLYYEELGSIVEAYLKWFKEGYDLYKPPWTPYLNNRENDHHLCRWQKRVTRYLNYCRYRAPA